MSLSLTGIVLTYQEELHVERCLSSLSQVCSRLVVIDSMSEDRTPELARQLGAEVYRWPWPGSQGAQLERMHRELRFTTDFVLRLDADEYLDEKAVTALQRELPRLPAEVTGLEFVRLLIFRGTEIRHGGFFPHRVARAYRPGCAQFEARPMDEHLRLLRGKSRLLPGLVVDDNLKGLDFFLSKHLDYARREAQLELEHRQSAPELTGLNASARRRRWLKHRVYYRLPLGLRPSLYFFYRFVLRCGFLDGPKGWVFHFLQAFWYRSMVDLFVYEGRHATQAQSRPGGEPPAHHLARDADL